MTCFCRRAAALLPVSAARLLDAEGSARARGEVAVVFCVRDAAPRHACVRSAQYCTHRTQHLPTHNDTAAVRAVSTPLCPLWRRGSTTGNFATKCAPPVQVYCGADFRFITVLSQFMPHGRPPVILDAGANIGAATVLFAHMAGLSARIFSVEAFPANIKVLQDNTAPLGDVVTVVPRAIVAHDLAKSGHVLNFTGDSNQYWGFRVDHTNTWDAPTRVTQQVKSTSLPMIRVRPRT